MAGASVGNAFLNVIPQVDTGAAAAAGSQAGGAMSGGLKGAISAGAVAIGNIISNAAISAAQTLGNEISKTFTNYADYQQLTGGVEKLFGKDAAATVKANAQDAFASAGMSANEYMQNVTSFSASLINSLGGDTQAAADAANMAMKDIADNANTYGTYSAQELANVYQNLAKGQFSTLDNLRFDHRLVLRHGGGHPPRADGHGHHRHDRERGGGDNQRLHHDGKGGVGELPDGSR